MRDIARGLFILAAMFLVAGLMSAWSNASTPELSVLIFLACAGILAVFGFIFLSLEKP